MIDKIEYNFTEDRNGKKMITIKNFPGLNCDMYPEQLEALINDLRSISRANLDDEINSDDGFHI